MTAADALAYASWVVAGVVWTVATFAAGRSIGFKQGRHVERAFARFSELDRCLTRSQKS